MTDGNREAFEAWALQYFDSGSTMEYMWEAWQAVHDHHAPKLTYPAAVEAAAKAIQDDSFQQVMPGAYCGLSDYDAKRYAVKALRAAGVRFKEEA